MYRNGFPFYESYLENKELAYLTHTHTVLKVTEFKEKAWIVTSLLDFCPKFYMLKVKVLGCI